MVMYNYICWRKIITLAKGLKIINLILWTIIVYFYAIRKIVYSPNGAILSHYLTHSAIQLLPAIIIA
jgi:hypothetical protein